MPPILLFVPGAWHRAIIFDDVRSRLLEHGYQSETVDLVTAGSDPVVEDAAADAEVVKKTLSRLLIEEQKEVLVVAHSYATIPSCNALKDFVAEPKSLVVGLVLVGAPLVPVGESVGSVYIPNFKPISSAAMAAAPSPPWRRMTPDGKIHVLDGPTRFYNALPEAHAQYWADRLVHHSTAYQTAEMKFAAWQHVPTTYLWCKRDVIVPVSDREKISNVFQNSTIEALDTDHSPFLSRPEAFTALIRRAAGEGGVNMNL